MEVVSDRNEVRREAGDKTHPSAILSLRYKRYPEGWQELDALVRYLKSDFLEAEPGLRIQIQVIYDVLPGESRKGIGTRREREQAKEDMQLQVNSQIQSDL